jgi:hypothetical protein
MDVPVFVTERAAEGFDADVIRRLPGTGKVNTDAMAIGPQINQMFCKL